MSADPRPPAPGFAELYARSCFSFLTGASHPEELLEQAASLGYSALAITDECSLAGVVRAYAAWRHTPDAPKLIIGSSIRFENGPTLVLLATDRAAYGQLSSLVTRGRRAANKGNYRLTRLDLAQGLPAGLALLVPPDLIDPDPHTLATDARWLAERFPDACWLAAPLHLGPDDATRRRGIKAAAQSAGIPVAATCAPLMHTASRRRLADVLTALRHRVTLDEAGYLLAANGEQRLQPREILARRHPPEWLAQTLAIAERCHFSLAELRYEYPQEIVPPKATPASHLRSLVGHGLRHRYPPGPDGHPQVPSSVLTPVEKELALIAELGYEALDRKSVV